MRKLTVGLPISNAMPYLPQAIESLLAQTVPDFDILAIVDECTDGSVEYMASLRDPRLRVVNQKRSGLIPTLNRMLREVETPWLVRLDADDIAYPTRIERTLEYVDRFPDAGMFAATAEYYPPGQSFGTFRASRGNPEDLRAIVQEGYLLSFCHPAVVLNVEKTLRVGGYRETLTRAEDADLWWRIALHYDIRIIPEVLLGYRQHADQATTLEMKQNVIDLLYVQYLLLSELWQLSPLPKENIAPLLERFVPERNLVAKYALRAVNIHASNKQYIRAVGSLVRAVAASPSFVLSRAKDEVDPERRVLNGVSPSLYAQDQLRFWPQSVGPEPRPPIHISTSKG